MDVSRINESCLLVDGVKVHSGFKLLPKDVIAITLFGHIFFRMSMDKLIDYLCSDIGRVTINHEKIHVVQAESFKLKYLTFYALYLWHWFKNLFKAGDAYENIPFEREAYANEYDFLYNETHWQSYA